jgi:CHAD domain-containing protein
LPPVLAAFGDTKVARQLKNRAARRRGAERNAARTALRLRAHGRVILELAAWLALDEPASAAEPLADFASSLIRKRHKRLVADAARFGALTAEERHQLRIDVKRLRYGVDALASVFPKKRVERYIDILVALQDALGHANDAINATRLLPELIPPVEFVPFARGWFAARAVGDPAVFEALLETLVATPRFWRKKPPDPAEG